MRFFRNHMRFSVTVGLLLLSLLIAEELRYGRVLGVASFPCGLVGGKHGLAEGRCVLRTCYWFDDCGHWAYPSAWRDHVAPGDSIATVVFWLGQPAGAGGDRYFWAYGKGGSGRLFAATFRDGRFVEFVDDAALVTKK